MGCTESLPVSVQDEIKEIERMSNSTGNAKETVKELMENEIVELEEQIAT